MRWDLPIREYPGARVLRRHGLVGYPAEGIPLRIAIRLVQYLGTPREVVELAVLAEQAGVDEIWIPHDPFMTSAWPLTAAIAERTSRVVIGNVGTNPYTTDPSEIATYLATLDLLSNGRAAIGLGLHTGDMVEWLGYEAADVGDRIAESVRMVRELLRGQTATAGRWPYHWGESCHLRFEPLRPDPPIYVVAYGRDLLRLSGAIGDGSMPMATPPASAGLLVEDVREGALAVGRDPRDVTVCACAWLSLAADGAGADGQLRRMIATFGPYLEERALATIGLDASDFSEIRALAERGRLDKAAALVTDEMLLLAISGTPEDVAGRIAALSSAGVDTVSLGGPLGPDPSEAIRLLGERVIPALL